MRLLITTTLFLTLWLKSPCQRGFVSETFPIQDLSLLHTMLPLEDNRMLVIRTKTTDSQLSRPVLNGYVEISLYNESLALLAKNSVDFTPEKQFLEKVFKQNGEVYLLVGKIDNEMGNCTLQAYPLDLSTLEIEATEKVVSEYRSYPDRNMPKLNSALIMGKLTQDYVFSPDYSHMAVINFDQIVHIKPQILSFKVLGQNMEEIESGFVDLNPRNQYRTVRSFQFFLSKTGELFLFFQGEDQLSKGKLAILIKLTGEDQIQKIILNRSGSELGGINLRPGKEPNSIFIDGFYTNNSKKFRGIAHFEVDLESMTKREEIYTPFSKKTLPNGFRIKTFASGYDKIEIQPLPNQDYLFIAEHYKKIYKGKFKKFPDLTQMGPIVIGKLSRTGELLWSTTVDKLQKSRQAWDLGFQHNYNEDSGELLIWFNYNYTGLNGTLRYENIKPNPNIMQMTIDANGQIKSKIIGREIRLVRGGDQQKAVQEGFVHLRRSKGISKIGKFIHSNQ